MKLNDPCPCGSGRKYINCCAFNKNKSHFDFKTILSFEDACIKLKLDSKILPDISNLPERLGKYVVSFYKLTIIFEAINNGWIADWLNPAQKKYFSFFSIKSDIVNSKFDFEVGECILTDNFANCPLCCESEDKASYIAKQFKYIYIEFLNIKNY